MRTTLAVTTLFTSSALAAGIGDAAGFMRFFMKSLDNSPAGKCHQMAVFGEVEELGSDPKIASAISGGDVTKQTMLQAMTTMLRTVTDPLEADKELVQGCQGTMATDREVTGCLMMQEIQKLDDKLANPGSTPMDPTRADKLKAISEAFKPHTDPIQTNETWTGFCKEKTDMRCISQKMLQKMVDLSKSSDAALNTHFNNNATAVQNFKDMGAKAQAKIDGMMKDAALMGVCGKMPNIMPINLDQIALEDLPKGGMGTMGMGPGGDDGASILGRSLM